MGNTHFLKTCVETEMKQRVQRLAERDLISESVWVKRAVLTALMESKEPEADEDKALGSKPGNAQRRASASEFNPKGRARLYVSLRSGDRLLLRDRAASRGMRPATYVSVLVRSHLRSLPPLPRDELMTLKRSVAELGAIGRNLNQLARAANQSRANSPTKDDLWALLRVCEALQDKVKGLIKANVNSWELGHVQRES